jgi:hypothetical protein
MDYTWKELDQLTALLHAEAEGRAVDREHARRLAERLAELCPDIRHSMHRVRDRMG